MRAAESGKGRVHLSVISLVEMVYLAERGRIGATVVESVLGLLRIPNLSYAAIDVDLDVVAALDRVPRDLVPDMPDRIIVATALYLGLPLVSRDERIREASVVPVVW
jgi:PIN domain nuclease of toxin-antitoxin system